MSQHPSRQSRDSSRKPSAAQPDNGAPRSRNSARPQRSGAPAADARGGSARREGGSAAGRGSKDAAGGERGRRGQDAAPRRSEGSSQQSAQKRPAARGGRGTERAADAGRGDNKPRREYEERKPRREPEAGNPRQSREHGDSKPRQSRERGEGSHRQSRDFSERRDTAERREYSPRKGGNAGSARRETGREPVRSGGAKEPFASGKAGAQPSAGGKERYPASDFARREGMQEGLPAVMVVNRSLKGYAFKEDFPWCLRLVVAYRADEESGLPLAKEERVLEAFEQNLFGLLKRSVNGHYVGHTSWSGTREFVFYVDEGSEAEDPLNGFGEKQKRELEFALDDDPRWEHGAHYFDYRD